MIEDERFLPIGTIVKVKGGKLPIMITSFCIIPKSSQKGQGPDSLYDEIYDYGGCPYPEGLVDANMALVFNHDQITEIIDYGYDSDEHDALSEMMNASIDDIKQAFKEGKLNKNDLLLNIGETKEKAETDQPKSE